MIGGLAVNCYVEPVYTVDADIVVVAEHLSAIRNERRILGERQGAAGQRGRAIAGMEARR